MLEASDLVILKRAFSRADHEFVRGYVYLSEDAITNRIEEVDPSWTFNVNRIEHIDNNAVCHATLIIKGVARDGVGMQQILEKAGEPAKGAATDALKRCARLFGIGRYLLDAPKEPEFDRWLAVQQKGEKSLQQQSSPAPASNVTTLPTQPQQAAQALDAARSRLTQTQTLKVISGEPTEVMDTVFGKRAEQPLTDGALFTATATLWNARAHFDNWWKKHLSDFTGWSLDDAIRFVQNERWNQDKDRVVGFFTSAENDLNMSSEDVMEALTVAAGRKLAKVRDWEAGDADTALAALFAWKSGYNHTYLDQFLDGRGTMPTTIAQAGHRFCDQYIDAKKKEKSA